MRPWRLASIALLALLPASATAQTAADSAYALPPNPALTWLGFSADGARFAFAHTRDAGIELWLGESATGRARVVEGLGL